MCSRQGWPRLILILTLTLALTLTLTLTLIEPTCKPSCNPNPNLSLILTQAGKTDVSEALEELFHAVTTQASREVLQNGFVFRRNHCYTEETDLALRAHEPALRILFTKYSQGEGVSQDSKELMKQNPSLRIVTRTNKMVSPGGWMCICRDLAFIGDDLSLDDARLIFQWSRMRVIDEDDPAARQRIENLTFWGFLEGVVRVSQSKAMPTDEEVEKSGYADGGTFLIRLKAEDPTAYREFIKKNDRAWWETTRQPIHKKISILLNLVMHTLAANLQRWQEDGTEAKVPPQGVVDARRSP